MAQVAANADVYASERLNKFFKGVVPSLDGQCVSLAKWFMQEMSEVPNPQAARGDARYVGKTLVAQGHAVAVPYADRKRGDIICYEYGQYGHIGVVLSGNRTFEENVKWPGVASKVVNGGVVYASRIGSLAESWRHDQHIYRLKTYTEDNMTTNREDSIWLWRTVRFKHSPTEAEKKAWTGKDLTKLLTAEYATPAFLKRKTAVQNYDKVVAENVALKQQLADAGGAATVLAKGKYEVK